MPTGRNPLVAALLSGAVALLLILLPAGVAGAAPAPLAVPAGDGGSSGTAVASKAVATPARIGRNRHADHADRRGGRVRVAWPLRRSAPAPRARLARWLARQVGPVSVPAQRRTAAAERRRRGARTAAAPSAVAAASTAGPLAVASGPVDPLLLVRSFDIPAGSPDAARLANYSWTYDNALAVFAFLSVDARQQAEQVLDQLRALQNDDGSLDFAYNVATGAGSGAARAGAMAWTGLAAVAYRRAYGNSRYDDLIEGVVDHLAGLRTNAGLVKGGSDVSWVSTQHNLLTVAMLRDLVDQLGAHKLGEWPSETLDAMQARIGDAVVAQTLRTVGGVPTFIAGVGDPAVPTDVQALGALYLQLRGDARAAQVAGGLLTNGFLVAPRRTAIGGLFSGYRPYRDATAPDVVWAEGTFQAALALKRLGVPSAATAAAVASLRATTNGGVRAPLGSDRDLDASKWGEFHTWPTSAAASWLLVLGADRQLLFAR